jgi:hypothetical protein
LISKYFITLHCVWFVYHGYVGEIIVCGIFWHYGGSFGSLLGHFTYFFRGAWASLSGSTYYPFFWDVGLWLFLHLSLVSNEIITLFFSIWWHMLRLTPSLLVGTTWYLSFTTLDCLFSSPPIWESHGIIISLFINLFDILFTWSWICHIFSRCYFGHHMSTYLILCKSNYKCLIISHVTTFAFWFSSIHLIMLCTYLGLPHCTIAHLSHC